METLLIQLKDKKALKLLLDLQDLQLIEVLATTEQKGSRRSEKYAGKLPASIGKQLQQHIIESRNEWSRDI